MGSRPLTEWRAMVREVEIRERRLYDEFVAEFKQSKDQQKPVR